WWGLPAQEPATDPLPSWNDGAAKKSITDFVARVTTQGGADFVPIDQRSATLDNDGTLWAEQPIYFQVVFALDRLKVLAAQHPEMRTEQPFKAALSEDVPALAALGTKQLLEIIAATHAGMSIDRFTCVPTASRPSSYRAAASSSCGHGLARRTASRLNGWLAPRRWCSFA